MSSRGKKVMDIEWKRDDVVIKVPVKAFTRSDWDSESKSRDGKIMKFQAEYPDAGILVEDSDINKVRSEVIDKLDQWYTISWELYFRVTIDGGDHGQSSTKFTVNYELEFLVMGKDSRGQIRWMPIPRPKDSEIATFDGKAFTRWNEKPRDGQPDTGVNLREKDTFQYGRKEALTKALVRATSENVKAAEQFTEALKSLLKKMHHHFAPERIENLLQNVGMLLPAPKEGGR